MSSDTMEPTDGMRDHAEGFTPSKPPIPLKKRKGGARFARIVNLLAERGVQEVSSWQMYDHLKHHGLADLWDFKKDENGNVVDPLGVTRTMSDIGGEHLLSLTVLRTEKGHGSWFKVRKIDEAYCKERGIALVD